MTLTLKQRNAVLLRAKGFDDVQIAHMLGVSVPAIKCRLRYARESVGARNTTQLVAIAVSRGEIEGTFDG